MTNENRMLITRIRRTQDNRAELFGKRHKYRDLLLFELADLADVGIDFEELPVGQEVPVKFYAYYTESEKQKSTGSPYLDVTHLTPIDGHGPASDLDASALLDELRAIHATLRAIAQVLHVEDLPIDRGGAPPAPEPPSIDLPDETPFEDDGPPRQESGNGNGQPLNEDQARREFNAKAGPNVRAGRITQARVTGLVQMAGVKGWRDALTMLEMELEAVKEIA